MQLDASEWLGRHIYVTGEYEPATTSVVLACLKAGDAFVDVGANAGYFSLLAAARVGSGGSVHCFEPFPRMHRLLENNIRLNRFTNCTTYEVALSNRDANTDFFTGPESHPGVSSLRPLADASARITVKTRSFDQVVPAGTPIQLVKIDVEGAECHVLEGMVELLRREGPDIILEVSPKYLSDLGRSPADIEKLVGPLGYRFFAIEHQGLRGLEHLSDYPSAQFNALLSRRAHMPFPTIAGRR